MKVVRLVCLSFLLVGLLAIHSAAVLAQDEQFKEKIELAPTYPKLEGIAGESFEFEVEFRYLGLEPRVFDVRATAPKDWQVIMTPTYEKEKKLSAIRLDPAMTYGNKIRVAASAPFWPLPEPGEYKVTLQAVSGNLTATTELKAIITAKYYLFLVPAIEQRYNTTATAGKDNIFSIKVQNMGTGAIENIKFSPTKPEGWTIEFKPDKIESLKAIDEQSIDVNIKPPPKTIAGDYMVSLRASGKQASSEEMKIRVTVESPTIWGWVGVGIILIVVVGLIIIFMQFSRR